MQLFRGGDQANGPAESRNCAHALIQRLAERISMRGPSEKLCFECSKLFSRKPTENERGEQTVNF